MAEEESGDYDFGFGAEDDAASKIAEIRAMGMGADKTDEQLAALVEECNMDMERISNKLLGL